MSSNNTFKNLLIISLDCVRREALGCYPHQFPWRVRIPNGSRTPNIDLLCANGHRFDQAVTHAPFTPVAHASLFTGLIPPNHGLRKFIGAELSENTLTMADVLTQNGWKCGAVVGSHALSKEFGLANGFDYYDDDIKTGIKRWNKGERRNALEVTDRAISWLSTLNPEDNFFLFIHYFDAHNIPVQPNIETTQIDQSPVNIGLRQKIKNWLPKEVQALMRPIDREVRSGYYALLRIIFVLSDFFLNFFEKSKRFEREGRRFMLNEVANIDAQFGRILQTLVDRGELEKTLIVIFADHGDDFMEHGEPTHRQYLYDTTLVVPLILYPFLGGRSVIGNQVSLVDLFPTLMSLLNVNTNNVMDGESLLPIIYNNNEFNIEKSIRNAYSETIFELIEGDSEIDVLTCYASLRAYPWKLIWDRLEDSYELYNLESDPSEQKNLVKNHPQISADMSLKLRDLAKGLPQGVKTSNDLLVKRLEALGYL
jgi:arylsulfatase A-like enzyme